MQSTNRIQRIICCGVLLIGVTVAGIARAEKPSWTGEGNKENKHENKHDKHQKHDRNDRVDDRRDEGKRTTELRINPNGSVEIRIADSERSLIRDYYHAQMRSGHCPPGLAKKNSSCLPPGQARKWSRGKALPAGVEFHSLPQELSVRLPVPPSGHRYVQVASDILLIAVGSSMVVDAIEDLTR